MTLYMEKHRVVKSVLLILCCALLLWVMFTGPIIKARAELLVATGVAVAVIVALMVSMGVTFASMADAQRVATGFFNTLSDVAKGALIGITPVGGRILLRDLFNGGIGMTFSEFWQSLKSYVYDPAVAGEGVSLPAEIPNSYKLAPVEGLIESGSTFVTGVLEFPSQWDNLNFIFSSENVCFAAYQRNTSYQVLFASSMSGQSVNQGAGTTVVNLQSSYSFRSKTVYYTASYGGGASSTKPSPYPFIYRSDPVWSTVDLKEIAWYMVYGDSVENAGDVIGVDEQEHYIPPDTIGTAWQNAYSQAPDISISVDNPVWTDINIPAEDADVPVSVGQSDVIGSFSGVNEAGDTITVGGVLAGNPDIPGVADTVLDDYLAETDKDGERIGLGDLFPFCIPFDVYHFLATLQSSREAPRVILPGSMFGAAGEGHDIDIDLSQFDGVARVLRTMELLAFCVGLAFVTRNHFIRG